MKTLLLTIDLVPASCWFSNVRSEVTKTQWDIIRNQTYSAAYHICQICGGVGKKHPVECHEIWKYDDKTLIQKLEGMIALCPDCHMVKHFGLAQIQNKSDKALKHFMKINKMSKIKAEQYIINAFDIWAKRSIKKWNLDISVLKNYGVNINAPKIKRKNG
jgi:hypothetical protein